MLLWELNNHQIQYCYWLIQSFLSCQLAYLRVTCILRLLMNHSNLDMIYYYRSDWPNFTSDPVIPLWQRISSHLYDEYDYLNQVSSLISSLCHSPCKKFVQLSVITILHNLFFTYLYLPFIVELLWVEAIINELLVRYLRSHWILIKLKYNYKVYCFLNLIKGINIIQIIFNGN